MKAKFVKNAKDLEHQALVEEYKGWFQLAIGGSLGLISNVLTLPTDIKTSAITLSFILLIFSVSKLNETKSKLEDVRDEISSL